jgi:RNA polymerase sigma-70 factor (ECF subfamily)
MRPANCAERGGRHAGRHSHADGSADRFAAEALPHLEQLYPAALRMAGEEPGAQELVMETYARAYASLGQRGDASITAWLYRNMADAAEENGLTGRGDPGREVPERHEPAPGPEDLPGRPRPAPGPGRVPGGEVKDALQQVPARSRFAIYLADVEGFSPARIARILQLPVSKVTSRLHRGRRQLRAALEARA